VSAHKKSSHRLPWQKILLFLLIVVFAVPIALFATHNVAQPAGPKPVIVIIGDSNSDPNSITQVQKWSQDYAMKHANDQIVINFALGGHAVEDFDNEEELALIQKAADMIPRDSKVVVVSLLGTNNALMAEKVDTPGDFSQNYNLFLRKVQVILKANYIIIGSIPPLYPNPANLLTTYTPNFNAYKLVDQYNTALENWIQIFPQMGNARLTYVPLFSPAAYDPAKINTYLIDDGIHLNRNSQLAVLDKVEKAIQTVLHAD